jgi:hypothetical protein
VNQARAGNVEVEKTKHSAAGQVAGELFQGIELAGHVASTDHGADRGAGDDVGIDAGVVEGAKHTDMRPSAGGTATKCQADLAVVHHAPPPYNVFTNS